MQERLQGLPGAELANIVNEAALRAVRRGSKVTMQEDLEEKCRDSDCRISEEKQDFVYERKTDSCLP